MKLFILYVLLITPCIPANPSICIYRGIITNFLASSSSIKISKNERCKQSMTKRYLPFIFFGNKPRYFPTPQVVHREYQLWFWVKVLDTDDWRQIHEHCQHRQFSIRWIGYASFTVSSFSFLESIQDFSDPSFIGASRICHAPSDWASSKKFMRSLFSISMLSNSCAFGPVR